MEAVLNHWEIKYPMDKCDCDAQENKNPNFSNRAMTSKLIIIVQEWDLWVIIESVMEASV